MNPGWETDMRSCYIRFLTVLQRNRDLQKSMRNQQGRRYDGAERLAGGKAGALLTCRAAISDELIWKREPESMISEVSGGLQFQHPVILVWGHTAHKDLPARVPETLTCTMASSWILKRLSCLVAPCCRHPGARAFAVQEHRSQTETREWIPLSMLSVLKKKLNSTRQLSHIMFTFSTDWHSSFILKKELLSSLTC